MVYTEQNTSIMYVKQSVQINVICNKVHPIFALQAKSEHSWQFNLVLSKS